MANFTLSDFVATKISTKLANRLIGTANDYADGVGDTARSFASSLVPTGTVILFAGATIPEGFLLCNGAAVSKEEYSNLYAAIGDLYGASGDESKFLLPDMRDRYPCGAGTNAVGTYLAEQLPNITGTYAVVYVDQQPNTIRRDGAFETRATSDLVFNMIADSSTIYGRWALLTFNAAYSSATYTSNGSVRPASLVFDYLIKT